MVMIGVITDKRGFIGEMYVTELIAAHIDLPLNIEIEIGYSPNFTRKYKLTHWKSGKRTAKVRIEGINTDEKTKQFMEMGIFVNDEILKSSNPATTFSHELVGLKVVDAGTGFEIGIVRDLLTLPANDVIVIDKGKSILSLPFVEEFISDIDLKQGVIALILPDGFENLEELKQDYKDESVD